VSDTTGDAMKYKSWQTKISFLLSSLQTNSK